MVDGKKGTGGKVNALTPLASMLVAGEKKREAKLGYKSLDHPPDIRWV